MTDRLRDALHDLAGQAKSANLVPRAMAGIKRRTVRRFTVLAAATAAVAALVSTGVVLAVQPDDEPMGPATEPPTSQEPSPSAAESAPALIVPEDTSAPAMPETWATIVADDRGYYVYQNGHGANKLYYNETWFDDGGYNTSEASDVAVTPTSILVASCCEPASGHSYYLDRGHYGYINSPGVPPTGLRVDARTDGSGPVVGVHSYGFLEIDEPSSEADTTILNYDDPTVIDAAVTSAGQVVTLNDQSQANGTAGPVGPSAPELHLWQVDEAGDWSEYQWDLDDRYCSVVPLSGGRIGLLRVATTGWESQYGECIGDVIDVFFLETGTLQTDVLAFDTPLRHLSVDDSGHWLLATDENGVVSWYGPDSSEGDLPGEGVLVADW